MTARDLITATLRSIRVLGVGDTLLSEDANDAFDRLNDWLDGLALERLSMYYVERTLKLLADDISYYTIGIGGDINIPRPTYIDSVGLIMDTGAIPPYERPLEKLTDQRWQRLPQKALTSTYPTSVYYDYNWQGGLAKLYVWPVPRGCGQTQLVIYAPVALAKFATLDTNYTFPPGYPRFIRTNFAGEIASEYGKQLTNDQVAAARHAKAQVKRANIRPVEARVDPALVKSIDYFDYRTGETGGGRY